MSIMTIPKSLTYQLTESCDLKISDSCCRELKKKPVKKWEKETNRHIVITGMRKEEGGTRQLISGCVLTDKNGNLIKFHPLLVVDDEWENWVIQNENIEICDLYKPPYNFKRTGCAGCPFSLELQEQLETMSLYLPNERKKCEIIWEKVYKEYRRLNYRLKRVEKVKLF